MTVVLLVISVEAGDYYYRGYEFIELKSVEGAACKLPGIPSLSIMVPPPPDCRKATMTEGPTPKAQKILSENC